MSDDEWHVHTCCLCPMMSGMSTRVVYVRWWVACPHVLFMSDNEWHVHTCCLCPMMSDMSTRVVYVRWWVACPHLVYIQSELAELGVWPQHEPVKIAVRLSAITVHVAWRRISGISAALSALHVAVCSVIVSDSLFFIAPKWHLNFIIGYPEYVWSKLALFNCLKIYTSNFLCVTNY
jgi:hypothetical protein